ncbi:hypothetical protein NQ318_005454 [Aromia moschata]|uniref:Uncharacterized protein n=1 Tax=Aromia moschata TaxID=1265417 RepID=A0AAV8YXI4_9CUCU|nr:hypothetical protein NQ318_005454 [Aromia moschata]
MEMVNFTSNDESANGKLLVVSYAWDGNALPGNEYWSGKLGSSGDSAAASSTQITELHNPHINPLVCGNNLRVITAEEIVTFEKYQEIVRCRNQKRSNYLLYQTRAVARGGVQGKLRQKAIEKDVPT